MNALGEPAGYKLVPGVNALPFNHPESPIGRRAGIHVQAFLGHPISRDELYPAGKYPNLHAGGDGLPLWTAKNRRSTMKISSSGTR